MRATVDAGELVHFFSLRGLGRCDIIRQQVSEHESTKPHLLHLLPCDCRQKKGGQYGPQCEPTTFLFHHSFFIYTLCQRPSFVPPPLRALPRRGTKVEGPARNGPKKKVGNTRVWLRDDDIIIHLGGDRIPAYPTGANGSPRTPYAG